MNKIDNDLSGKSKHLSNETFTTALAFLLGHREYVRLWICDFTLFL